jgi:hypothetical protein
VSENVYERAAVAKARELGLLSKPRFAAEVLAARDMGRRMDAAQPYPSFRLTSAYQSAMGALERRGAALAKERTGAPSAGSRKAERLREMRADAAAHRARMDAGLPAFDEEEYPRLSPAGARAVQSPDGPRTVTPTVTPPAAGNAAGNDDVELLQELDPPPRSVADVRDRLRWGTGRASAALRAYREEADRG